MAFDITPVKDVIPHREPFLFVDEVLELTEDTIRATRTVSLSEPQFAGHYPNKPIMPGVLLCETVLQAGAYLVAKRMGEDASMEGAPVVTRMNKVKFKRIVRPGDVLEISAEHLKTMMGAHSMKGTIKVDGKLSCSLEFIVMLADESKVDA